MKIAFVGGSLAAGKTGVGDYSLLLADACRKRGITCATLGLHDPHIEGKVEKKESLRLSQTLPWERRLELSKSWLKHFDPDWISLQFVPYAFHPRGLFQDFLNVFPRILESRKLQIMFHEIWIGEFPGSPWLQKACGLLQKRYVRKLLKKTMPLVINHSCAGAEVRLKKAGMQSEHLPIFGNIPPIEKPNPTRFHDLLNRAGLRLPMAERSDWWILGFFGSIQEDWEVELSVTPILEAAKKGGKKVAVLSLGRLGETKRKWDQISAYRKEEVNWVRVGELDSAEMSLCLHGLDYGLTSTPWDLVGKSGAIAALVEHGVPIFVSVEGGTKNAPLVIGEPYRHLIHRTDDSLYEKLVSGLLKTPSRESLSMVTDLFLQQLAEHEKAA